MIINVILIHCTWTKLELDCGSIKILNFHKTNLSYQNRTWLTLVNNQPHYLFPSGSVLSYSTKAQLWQQLYGQHGYSKLVTSLIILLILFKHGTISLQSQKESAVHWLEGLLMLGRSNHPPLTTIPADMESLTAPVPPFKIEVSALMTWSTHLITKHWKFLSHKQIMASHTTLMFMCVSWYHIYQSAHFHPNIQGRSLQIGMESRYYWPDWGHYLSSLIS